MSSSTIAHRQAAPQQLRYSLMTISDTRKIETDESGAWIIEAMEQAGHKLLRREIVPDLTQRIADTTCQLCADPEPDVLIMTGGTGISPRDRTPEAVQPLIEVPLPGFGELFRMLSYAEIGPATMLSRALAGRRGATLIFCLPGSSAAVRLAMQKILLPELPHLVLHSRS